MQVPGMTKGREPGSSTDSDMPTTPVAVVGISCRLPGGVNSLDKLWELLEVGGETWSPVPPDRFNEAAFHHPSSDDPNGTNNHRGGHFIDGDIRDFDHSFFRLSPQQAMAMDPQQRILLEMSYEALENAGWSREVVAGSDTSVYVAMFTTDYDRNLYKDTLNLPVYYITGSEKAILANRISHVFDLRGSSVTLDTACSGGLVALHQACQGLHSRESSASIVAAANITLNPDHYIGMSNLHMIGSSGRCFPFDDRGVGYGRGEGFAVLVLKRLDDALRDGDPIHSVIRSTAVNHNGYTPPGITYPSGLAQADLIRAAYKRGGRRPQDVSYIEAHGTGTVAGDNEELSAISTVFANQERSLPLYVGSVKGNIGHTENTSGLASLLKSTLILDRRQIPPVAGFLNPKPGLPLGQICIPTEVVPLPIAQGVAPFVSINSFGFGGANAHAILEQRPQSHRSEPIHHPCPRLFVFSANSRTSLQSMMKSYCEWLNQRPGVSLADVSYSLCHRRSSFPWGLSCVASDRLSLMEELDRGIASCPSKPRPTSSPYIALVFTGQGAQWAGMGKELLVREESTSPLFRSSLRTSRDILISLGSGWDLEAELLRDAAETQLNVAELAQPATTAIQIALVDVLRAQGIRPRAVVGHSSGEIAAAYTAGYLSHRAAIEVSFARGRVAALTKTRCPVAGAMMSVGLGEHEITPYMKSLTKGVLSIACVNCPTNVTISGDAEAMDELATRLAASDDGIFHRRLVVDTAYHSHHMEAVADEYCRILKDQQQRAEEEGGHGQEAGITFVSSVTGTLKSSDFDPEYWTRNLVSTVPVCDAIQSLVRKRASDRMPDENFVFLEVGPHPALAGPVRQSIAGLDRDATPGHQTEFSYYPTLQRKAGAVSSMLALAGHLLESGMKLNFDHVSALTTGFHKANVLSDLPSYAWDHSVKHWYESRISREYRMRRDPYHDLLGVRLADSTSIEPRWRHMVSLTTLPWLAHHVIDGLAIFPGAGYLCMAIEATRQLSRERYASRELETIALRHVSFLQALVVPEPPQDVEMQLTLRPKPGKALAFSFYISALSDGEWHQHCTGIVEGIFQAKNAGGKLSTPTLSMPEWLPSSHEETVLDTEMIYRTLGESGNTYGPSFVGIRSMSMTTASSPSATATATIGIPDTASIMPARHQEPHLIHPSTLDIMLHAVVPLVSRQLGPGSVMPVYIDELLLAATASMPRSPGSELGVSATLTASQFRTAHADLVAISDCLAVVIASGIEMRSLGSRPAASGNEVLPGDMPQICYELDWHPDLEFLTNESASDLTLKGLLSYLSFKLASFSVLDLCGADDEELSAGLVDAIKASGSKLTCYDCISSVPENYKKVQEAFRAHSILTRLIDLEGDLPEDKTPEDRAYDVVLASTSDSMVLNRASSLMKPGGVLLLRVIETASLENHTLGLAAILGLPASFDVQLICRDTDRRLSVAVGRSHMYKQEQPPPKIHILSHEAQVGALEQALRNSLTELSADILSPNVVNRLIQDNEDNDQACFLVVDGLIDPILSNPEHFATITELLNQPTKIIWLSPDTPFHMQQVTGVARTAHAENDKLRLVTIHAAPERMGNEVLHRLVAQCFSLLHRGLSTEREYRLRSDGTILVPRLRRSDQLNYAVGYDRPEGFDIQRCHFKDSNRVLVLNVHNTKTLTDVIFSQEENSMLETPLGEDAVEIETEAFVLSMAGLKTELCEHVGIVTRVGCNVLDPSLVPGSCVMALASVTGASRLRISQSLVGIIPTEAHISPANATAMLFNLMLACHALHGLARLQPTSTVLIHGALSPLGSATVAVARAIGARVKLMAVNQKEAQDLIAQLDIPAADLLLDHCSLSQRLATSDFCIDGLDAIVLASEEELAMPTQVLPRLKPFGHVVSMVGSTRRASDVQSQLPPNTSFHSCDIEGLLGNYPESSRGNLLGQVVLALKYLPICSGSSVISTRDVGQVREALQMIDSGIQNQVIVTTKKDSMVMSMARKDAQIDNRWTNEDVSYVVSGGLGDLGRRLLCLMAGRGAKHLVTLSRRTVDPQDYDQLQAKLEAIQPGCRLYCLTCDLTSESSVQKAAATLSSKGVPPVRGVINSAAILQDMPLASMTSADFSLVSKVKVEGTRALANAFASHHLEFFIMLSSAANIVGTSGQANYNAGNAAQDALAYALQGNPCHYMSLSIGWIEDALITMDNEARLGGLRRAGLRAIRSDELARFLDHALGAAAAAVQNRITQAVIGFDAASLLAATTHNGNIRSPMFSHVHSIREARASDEQEGSELGGMATSSFEQVLASGDGDRVVESISAVICRQFIKLTSADASRVSDTHGSMLAFGLDSLVAIELRNWLMREYEAPLQSSEILNDQTIRVLAAKVASRSRIVAARLKDNQVSGEKDSSLSSITSSGEDSSAASLPPLPLPALQDTLRLFEESRRAVDSPETQALTAKSVAEFLEATGPTLQQKLEKATSETIAESYEHQVYLGRREPLQDYSQFSLVHPVDAPAQSQIERAAVLTVAVTKFARRLLVGDIPPDSLHGVPTDGEARDWLFWATRLPGEDLDTMERYPSTPNIIILRRGHIFQLTLPGLDVPLQVSAVHEAYSKVINLSETPETPVCTLTADDRKSWYLARSQLELNHDNTVTLSAIDSAMFVVCLDDEEPSNPGERYIQFLTNGRENPFSNRWLDKPVQFIVTKNGLSAGLYEHAKIDALDVRSLHRHVIDALFAHGSYKSTATPPTVTYPIREYVWSKNHTIIQRIKEIQHQPARYSLADDYSKVYIENLSLEFLRSRQAPPHATTHLVALLAVYLVDRRIRSVWEIVSLGIFERGRIDWVQTVSLPVRSFLEAAAAAADDRINDESIHQLLLLFHSASQAYSKSMSMAARGSGAVRHLYALYGALREEQNVTGSRSSDEASLFQTQAWEATRRGGSGQDFKIGFMPDEDSPYLTEWDEGGFLMQGENAIYIHCGVHERALSFIITAQSDYNAAVCKALERASTIVQSFLV